MKQAYKDLMMKYLEEHPGLEVTSNPIGWWRNLQKVGKTTINNRDSILQGIVYNEIEPTMVALLIRDNVPNATISYKFKYDKDEKTLVGKVKKRNYAERPVVAEVKVPEDIWFDRIDIRIDLKGKSSVDCSVKLNVRNGMVPPRTQDVEAQMASSISRQFCEQLRGKGRVSQTNIRRTLNYSDIVTIEHSCQMIIHDNEDITIKL